MKRLAIMYDWDKTLSPKYMSEFGLVEKFGFDNNRDYWNICDNVLSKNYQMDAELAFMYSMVKYAKENKIKLDRKFLNSFGKKIEYFNGVEEWFRRINDYGKQHNILVEHYIISSGIYEIIESTSIFKYFKKVFASRFVYDEKGLAFWPAMSINYTAKTQYIFRIKKNILDDIGEDKKVNKKLSKKDVLPYENMIYVGDGDTDIPCMKIVKDKGGNSICVYHDKEGDKDRATEIKRDGRVNFIALADYSENSDIDKYIKKIILNLSSKK